MLCMLPLPPGRPAARGCLPPPPVPGWPARSCAPPVLYCTVPQGTRVEGMVNKLFEGHTVGYVVS